MICLNVREFVEVLIKNFVASVQGGRHAVFSFLTRSCEYESGWYYAILDNSAWDLGSTAAWDLSVRSYNGEAKEITLGTNNPTTITAGQTDPFAFFYYDQEELAGNTVTFSSTSTDSAGVFSLTYPYGGGQREYALSDQFICGSSESPQFILSVGSIYDNNDAERESFACSPYRGRFFFAVLPSEVPYSFQVVRFQDEAPSSDYNTANMGDLTNLVHSSGSNKVAHYWKLESNGRVDDDGAFNIYYDNTNSSSSAYVFF